MKVTEKKARIAHFENLLKSAKEILKGRPLSEEDKSYLHGQIAAYEEVLCHLR